MKTAESLEFVKLTSNDEFNMIPASLFEQISGRSWEVDRLLKMDPSTFISGCSKFFVLVNKEGEVKGILWTVIDILSEKLNVIAFEVDEEYKCDNDTEMALEFLRTSIEDFNSTPTYVKLKKKINWITDNPDKLKQYGGSIPETVMIEI